MKSTQEIARVFGCTEQQARRQVQANLAQIQTLASTAPCRGYSKEQLVAITQRMERTLDESPRCR